MKHALTCIAGGIVLATPAAAHAADPISGSVNLYGLIDLGLTYYSSTASGTGGDSLVRVDSGIAQSSRIGFRGSEDLGGGNTVFFTLETGFAADTGTLGQNGAIFGRQALVGIRNKRLGSLSIGRQYDFMSNLGIAYAMGANTAAGSFAWGLHADAANGAALNNHIYVGDRTNNAIKYQSADMNGFTAGVMVGAGEVAGNARAGRTVSGLAAYTRRGFSMGTAFAHIRNATDTGSTRIGGFGASYAAGVMKYWGVATSVTSTLTGDRARTFEIGAARALVPAVDIGMAYQYQVRSGGIGDAQAIVAIADYKFTSRTDAYLGAVYANDDGRAAYPVFGGGVQAAGGVQTAVRLGLRHRF